MGNRNDPHKNDPSDDEFGTERIPPPEGLSAELESHDDTTLLRCPNCSKPVRMGELICPHCDYNLTARDALHTQRMSGEPLLARTWTSGEVIVAERKPIVLEIDGQQITLPLADVVTLGRRFDAAPAEQPHVDLSRFGAEEHGVSRLHARLRRKGILVYIADMGSLNGTHLNGRRLIPDGERLLRDNDELYLSRLRIRVHFS